ncbi:MAG: DNA polymerase I [Lachnospiraceae bacterium]|nr:DNA polymerase I [Lachnospiraceae bacterium]
MNEKIVLIDGHSILNRAFYGLPDLTNAEGLHTNAVYGFLNILFKILEEEHPEYLAVAFDLHAPTFRHQMYDAYKGTRKSMPEELREQVPLIKDVLTAMGIEILEKEGYEADDILGTIACRCEKEGMEVTILSGDRDLLQLATDHILIRIPKTVKGKTVIENYHTTEVQEKYQLSPGQIVDLKSLMGDTADNIPGLPGVGEKTATKILLEFHSLENAYEHLEEVKPAKAKEALRNHYDLAVLSKKLAKIQTESPVDFQLADARIGNFYTPKAYELFRRLEFKNLLGRFGEQETACQEAVFISQVTELEEAERLFGEVKEKERVGIFVLSESGKTAGVALAYGSMEDPTIAFIQAAGFLSGTYLLGQVREVIEKVPKICVMNVKELLKCIEIEFQERIFDAALAAYLLNPLKTSYAYDDLAREYSRMYIPTPSEIFGTTKIPSAFSMSEEQAASYAGHIAFTVFEVCPVMEERLLEQGMWELYRDVELPLAFVLHEMERDGIAVKREELIEYGKKLQVRIEELEQKICEQAGEEFNINSPKQLGVILFEKMQLPGGKKTKTGYSTAADVLEKLAPEHQIVSDILEYRQLTKLKSTYADGLLSVISPDGRIHSTFHQTITATGRISSTEPNLQNIPARMELGRLIRKAFVPKPGCVFLDADYSQIELRVLAHMSGDEKLIAAYREAEDIHRLTASQVFHVPLDQVTPLQRRNAKAVNFGIVYGISSFGLSQDLSITKKEAEEYINSYFETYPKIKSFLNQCVQDAKDLGYSVTIYGRRRPIPELKSSNFMQRSFGERVAMNAPIQGTAADIIKIAMIRVSKRLKEEKMASRLLLQVHDELLLEVPQEETEKARKILAEEMTGVANLEVKLEIDMHTGNDWYEAK